MKRKLSGIFAASIGAFLFGAVLFVHAQDAAPPPPPEAEFLGIEMGPGPHHVVKNAPYSAQTKIEITQTLADGTHIDSTSTGASYRDSQGRTRREQTLNGIGPLPMAHGKSGQFIMIHDPVAGTHYVLDPSTKTATTGGGPHGGPHDDKGAPEAWRENREKPDSANVTTESLGTQTIDGVTATGTRTTRTIPAGQIGNDKPIQVVSEKWVSPDLQVVVMSKHSDPRLGTFTYQLTNITRSEPASSLFQVPPDYTVKQGGFHHGPGGPPPAAAPPQE